MPRPKAAELQKLHRLKRSVTSVFEDVVAIALALQQGDHQIAVIEKEIDEAFKDLKDLLNRIISEDNDTFDATNDEIINHRVALREAKTHLQTITRSESTRSSPSPSGDSAIEISLPALKLPTFSGEVENWTSFADLFQSALQARPRLTGSQKLQYLNSSLKGTAAELLEGIPIENGNFDEAWSLLDERYNHPRQVITKLIDKFAQYPLINNQTALQGLLDVVHKNLRLLKVMKQPVEHWDSVLVYIIRTKINHQINGALEENLPDKNMPDLNTVLKFLSAKAQATNFQQTAEKTNHTVQRSSLCPSCKSNHPLFKCNKFGQMTPNERWDFVKAQGICRNCLSSRHSIDKCQAGACKKCGRQHHTQLHADRQTNINSHTLLQRDVSEGAASNYPGKSSDNPGFVASSLSPSEQTDTTVLLPTAAVHVITSTGTRFTARALIDTCAQVNIITESLVRKLQLPVQKTSRSVLGVNTASTGAAKGKTRFTMRSRINEDFILPVECIIYPKITSLMPESNLAVDKRLFNSISLADPHFSQPGEIDLLLGVDVCSEIMLETQKRGLPGSCIAQETRLGWVIYGRSPIQSATQANPEKSATALLTTADLTRAVKRFWEMESVPHEQILSPEEERCSNDFKLKVKRQPDGRYQVNLPFSSTKPDLGASRGMAIKRLNSLERRFQRTPAFKEQYSDVLEDYLRQGHMEPVPPGQIQNSRAVYLPHHAVIRHDKATTKLRVVFDASAKTTNGRSLNDELLNGPRIQDDLFTILTRFRCHAIAMTADIKQMYRQIRIAPEDADHQRIVWRNSENDQIQDYRLLTVTFGTKSAPYLAVRTLQQLATDESESYSQAAAVTQRDFYVDDLMTGAANPAEAIKLKNELTQLLKAGGFELCQWASNSPEITDTSAVDDQLEAEFRMIEEDNVVKTLGLKWSPSSDHFSFTVKLQQHISESRRTLLSDTAKIFDPLGWLAPITIIGKILIQHLWTTGGWDDPLPPEIQQQWTRYKKQLEAVSRINIVRKIICDQSSEIMLCGFCDASEKTYAAAVYLRCSTRESVSVQLVAAKTRVAPLKPVTIPRLELCAALLLSQLIQNVQNALPFGVSDVRCWTDSTVVLTWLAIHPSKLKTFVSHRVGKIQDTLPLERWHHIPGIENPADLASRGVPTDQMASSPLWWHGPPWLQQPEFNPRPPSLPPTQTEVTAEERRQPKAVILAAPTSENPILERFSSFHRLCRFTARVKRFVKNHKSSSPISGPLTADELQEARTFWISHVQIQAFPKDIHQLSRNQALKAKSKLLPLQPFLDKRGLLRVGGRIFHASISSDQKHPILLPKSNHLTNIIVRETHYNHLHAGPQLTMAAIRQQYWVVGLRDITRKVIHKCGRCVRFKVKSIQQLMGQLPPSRVTQSRPFQKCCVDFAGPIQIRTMLARGSRTFKGYIAVFVCFTTKAIHLEAVSQLTSSAFIATLKRFIGRRGKPETISSDNGTNFVGAEKELTQFLKQATAEVSDPAIADYLSQQGIQWAFIPPGAPHFGGLWEAGVKSVKSHLRRAVGMAKLNFEELSTVLISIEACLNSRPITEMSSDPTDLAPLTPGHFLIGAPLTSPPEVNLEEVKDSHLSRWQLIQKLSQHFWRRWHHEYLTRLQQRPKWWAVDSSIQVGQLVLLKDENLPPMMWKLARILELHSGKDNHVRVVKIKTESGAYTRPVTKICPQLV